MRIIDPEHGALATRDDQAWFAVALAVAVHKLGGRLSVSKAEFEELMAGYPPQARGVHMVLIDDVLHLTMGETTPGQLVE